MGETKEHFENGFAGIHRRAKPGYKHSRREGTFRNQGLPGQVICRYYRVVRLGDPSQFGNSTFVQTSAGAGGFGAVLGNTTANVGFKTPSRSRLHNPSS
jgi:hypothetical protein